MLAGEPMSTEYLYYIASVSQINQRGKRSDRERNFSIKSTRTKDNFRQSLNHGELEYRKDKFKMTRLPDYLYLV